jgi:hypothetical protein
LNVIGSNTNSQQIPQMLIVSANVSSRLTIIIIWILCNRKSEPATNVIIARSISSTAFDNVFVLPPADKPTARP